MGENNTSSSIDNYKVNDDAKDGLYLTFAHSGYNVAPKESVNYTQMEVTNQLVLMNGLKTSIATILMKRVWQIEVLQVKCGV